MKSEYKQEKLNTEFLIGLIWKAALKVLIKTKVKREKNIQASQKTKGKIS